MRRLALFSITIFLIVAAWYRPAPAQNAPRTDYLNAQLRRAVTQLKRDAAATPTSAANLASRGKILLDWVNAYSLTGGPVPVNASQQLGAVFAFEAGERGTPDAAATLARAIDALIKEFTLKDEKPGAIPTVRLSTHGPFPAGSEQTIEQTVTIGDLPFTKGAKIVAAKQMGSDFGLLQNSDPAAANYVSIRSSQSSTKFRASTIPMTGMHGGFRAFAEAPLFELIEGVLRKGDTVTLKYGPRLRMQSFANDRVLLPVYVDPDAGGVLLTLAWEGFAVSGNDAVSLRLIAPSILKAGETFEFSVRGEDRLVNRAGNALPAISVKLNGQPLRDLPPGAAWRTVPGLRIDKPGIYRLTASTADGKLSGESNPIWVEENPTRRLYWGETHAHTGMSEGQGSIDGFYRYGKEDAYLDFLGLSEHDIWLDDFEWSAMQQAVTRYTAPGKFIAFLGYEWTAQRPNGGHHNVFFRTPDRQRVPSTKAWTLSRLYQGLRALYDPRDVIIIPHAHQAGEWRRNDPDMERLVEIMSMHGTFEWFGNYYLKRGADVGFVAASDDHRTRPGLSGATPAGALTQFGGLVSVTAKEKSAPAIFDALRARATYAVSGSDRILLDYTLNGIAGGQRGAFNRERRVKARISGSSAIDRVDVVKNGGIVFTRRFASAPLSNKVTAQVSFESDSEPYMRDNPRGHRIWRGTLEVSGAKLAGFRLAHFDNGHVEFARLDSGSPNKLSFSTMTRGRPDILELDLDGATASTSIVINLESTTEVGASPPAVRPAATIPATTATLRFGEIKDGLLVHEMRLNPHRDSITLQLIDTNAAKDRELEFTDRDNPLPGDYYYVRVTQRNGSRAWSSPVWVGGEPAR